MRYMSSWWFVFVLSWFLSRASLRPFSRAHTFRYLDVIMLLPLGDAFLTFGSIQLWIWMNRIKHLMMDDLMSDFPTYYTSDAILGHISFWLRLIDLHLFAWSFPLTGHMSSWWSIFVSLWFPSGAFLWPFSQAHTFRYWCDSLMELSQGA